MKKFIWKKRFSLPEAIGLIGIAVICVSVVSYAVTVPHTFTSGTTAKSSEVNANFAALVSAVTALETQVAALQANNALQLGQYLTISSATTNGLAGPHLILDGVNLHIRNGDNETDTINGVGNLIVGYNEGPSILNPGDRGGSHNLIIGPQHKYLKYGGFVAGQENTVSGNYASVSGGDNNTASGNRSSVSGGNENEASGLYASVSGGYNNAASNSSSSVSGGYGNEASYYYASVSGGVLNTASGWYASVSGGSGNGATTQYASVSGGQGNTANGQYSSISGGNGVTTSATDDWKACDVGCTP